MKKHLKITSSIMGCMLALPMSASANHRNLCMDMYVNLIAKPGYVCKVKGKRWYKGNVTALSKMDISHVDSSQPTTFYFMARAAFPWNKSHVDMNLACQPVDGMGPETTISITSKMNIVAIGKLGRKNTRVHGTVRSGADAASYTAAPGRCWSKHHQAPSITWVLG